jgi:hypothetical protein
MKTSFEVLMLSFDAISQYLEQNCLALEPKTIVGQFKFVVFRIENLF